MEMSKWEEPGIKGAYQIKDAESRCGEGMGSQFEGPTGQLNNNGKRGLGGVRVLVALV
jgi:hypothetical protein